MISIPTEQTLPLPSEYIEQLKATEQNPRFHAEGSVYNHTLLVLQQFEQGADEFDLTQDEREVLYWAVVLHDIGKPAVTEWRDGRWRATGHEESGVPIARNLLANRPEISLSQRQKILDLVNFHQIPLRWGLAEKTIHDYKKLSIRTDIRLLGIFAYFDMLGRICEDHDRVLELIGDFNEVIVPRVIYETGTFGAIQEIYQRAGLQQKNALWNTLKLDDISLLEKLLQVQTSEVPTPLFQCHITVGVENSGQKDYINQYFPQAPVHQMPLIPTSPLSPHDTGTYLRQVKHFLSVFGRGGKNIVVDGDTINPGIRIEIIEFVRNLGGQANILFFDSGLDGILEGVDDTDVQQSIRDSYQKLRVPHPWEGHKLELIN